MYKRQYVKKYPNSKYVPDAKVRIEQFNLPVFTVSQAKQIASAQTTMMPFVIAAVFYFVFNLLVAIVMDKIEKKLNYYR